VNAEKAVADLQARLNELQGKVGLARYKVANFQKATVDSRLSPPDGHGGDYPYPYPYRIRDGNFSSEFERQEAVRKTKEELLPIEIELRKTQDELAKAKLDLGKMRANQGTK
jgi:hypothetical protein